MPEPVAREVVVGASPGAVLVVLGVRVSRRPGVAGVPVGPGRRGVPPVVLGVRVSRRPGVAGVPVGPGRRGVPPVVLEAGTPEVVSRAVRGAPVVGRRKVAPNDLGGRRRVRQVVATPVRLRGLAARAVDGVRRMAAATVPVVRGPASGPGLPADARGMQRPGPVTVRRGSRDVRAGSAQGAGPRGRAGPQPPGVAAPVKGQVAGR